MTSATSTIGGLSAAAIHQAETNFDSSVARLSALLSIPSISTDSAYDAETRRAAQWLADELAAIGFDAAVHPTKGHPMVVAKYASPAGRQARVPTILYYGHYDVQPPDPLELWDSPPFEPTVVDGAHGKRIIARGAVDDKGQLMTFVEAFRAWKEANGELPVNITVMLEGEEESGSPSLDPFLKSAKDELAADVCVVCDTGMWDINTPAITYMLRGLVYIEVTLHGPSHDLHSGMYGGALVNPINALCRVLAQLHDDAGRVQVPGFYDDVLPLGEAERAQWNSLGFDEKEFLGSAGMKTPFGEKGCSTLERTWSRPTCDINGIYGGYIGKGAKTVIGSHASAKLSCRLVANQNPRKIYDGLVKFFESRTPPDCRWEIKSHGISPAIRVPTESPYLEAARKGLKETYNKDAVLIGSGGSIPVVGSIQQILGFDSLLVGFGLDDDRVHSPNEKFELRCYEMGIKSHIRMLEQFASLRAS
ncbi:MAG TPA: dipeptidase [Phycisphaerales bacterium]|nr:dipeptidase [Phycisphaerales bacterium]